jgi:hypothetical protein
VGAYPNADCSGVCLAGAVQCASSTTTQTCTPAGQWGTASACTTLNVPPGPACNGGKCAYRGGSGQKGATTNTIAGGYIYALRFQVTVATTAYRLGMFGSTSVNNVRMAIYSGNSAEPLGRLGLTPAIASSTVDGAMEGALGAPLQLQPGNYYWIAAIGDTNVGIYATASGAGYFLSTNPSGWNILTDPFPSGGSQNFDMTPNFYVVLRDQ